MDVIEESIKQRVLDLLKGIFLVFNKYVFTFRVPSGRDFSALHRIFTDLNASCLLHVEERTVLLPSTEALR